MNLKKKRLMGYSQKTLISMVHLTLSLGQEKMHLPWIIYLIEGGAIPYRVFYLQKS
jgi:hypothetical protein